MKKISILIPTYNEQDNVENLSKAIISEMSKLSNYDYDITFIDNDSKDNTRNIIRQLCASNSKIKAIFNAKNFGQNNSPVYGITQTDGDCTILMCADFQDPVEMLPKLVHEWEKGYKIVSAIKTSSKENKIIRCARTIYYKLIKKFSDVEQIEHFTGFGLYDKSFVEILRNLNDSSPFLRGIVAEFGYKRKEIPYEQQLRKAGKSKNNFFSLYDIAMLSFTSYTKIGLRLATFVGFILGLISFIVAIIYLVFKIKYWNDFSVGMAPVIIGLFFLGGVELTFLGLIGEYILTINKRIMNRPLVIEEERLNFNDSESNVNLNEGEKLI